MRNISAAILILHVFLINTSAQDTIMSINDTIVCDIQKIGFSKVVFHKWDRTRVMHKAEIIGISKEGKKKIWYKEDIENVRDTRLNTNLSALKFSFTGPFFGKLEMEYERINKLGKNYCLKFGYLGGSNLSSLQGGIISIGKKYILNKDYLVKDFEVIEPLNGSYLLFGLTILYLSDPNEYLKYVSLNTYESHKRSPYYGTGFHISYGEQYLMYNVLAINYSFGIGVSELFFIRDNPKYINEEDYIYSFGFIRPFGTPISLTGTVSVGYLF